jgi:hypothetical protein
MAVRALTANLEAFPNCATLTWAGLLGSTTDTGEPAEYPQFNDKTVHVNGTLGVGGSVSIEGSNNNVNWKVLTDPQGNPLTFTAVNMIEQIMECPRYIRPNVTAGDGTTNFNVVIQCTKGSR